MDTPELDAANADRIWMTGLKTKVCLMIPPTGDARKTEMDNQYEQLNVQAASFPWDLVCEVMSERK
jgi:hypothetical protein